MWLQCRRGLVTLLLVLWNTGMAGMPSSVSLLGLVPSMVPIWLLCIEFEVDIADSEECCITCATDHWLL